MTIAHSTVLKNEFTSLRGDVLLRSPVSVLLGVDAAATGALAAIHVVSVFDLGTSAAFAVARRLVEAENDPSLPEVRQQAFAAEDVTRPLDLSVAELARQPITILRALGAGAAPLAAALDVNTVRELAAWAPYQAARALVAEIAGFGFIDPDGPDASAAQELTPLTGVFPSERVTLRRLVMEQTGSVAAKPLEQLAAPIDVATLIGSGDGFTALATGALLTFSQSWYAQGVALGQLLHSLSLAPGESTRMAMVDWTRRSSGSGSEAASESESLDNTQQQSRALSEVTQATATEVQSGSSTTEAKSRTVQVGSGFGLEVGPLAIGGSSGSARTTTQAMTVSSSFGSREMAAQSAQQINERTQQHASSARSRRASVVREVSQSEHESLSTRVVTNYNHMHTLNVQYYEVIQSYRVTTQLERAERCLFIPIKPLDFATPGTIDRWRDVLAAVALTGAARRQLLLEQAVVEVAPSTSPRLTLTDLATDLNVIRGTGVVSDAGGGMGAATGGAPAGSTGPISPTGTVGTGGGLVGTSLGTTGGPIGGAVVTRAQTASAVRTDGLSTHFDLGPMEASTTLLARRGFDIPQLARLGSVGGRSPLRLGSDSVFVPEEALLLGATLLNAQAARVSVLGRNGAVLAASSTGPTHVALAAPGTPIRDVSVIQVQPRAGDPEQSTLIRLQLQIAGAVLPLDVPLRLAVGAAAQTVVRIGAAQPSPELVRHLLAHRMHYSRAVIAGMDSATVAGLLSRHTYRGLPLSAWVDPAPVAQTGNALVFKLNIGTKAGGATGVVADEQTAFRNFLTQRGLAARSPISDQVALPTGGVFAEGVLGRSNAAEKIDLTRFWNWQDSPIPITAPEIATLEAGSRNRAFDMTAGASSTPMLRQAAPTTLPAPTGMAPLLAAMAAGGPFRDMSGAAVSAQLAAAASQATGRAANAGSTQAAANLKTVMEQNTARMRIASDLLKAQAGAKAGGADQGAAKGSATERGMHLAAAEDADVAGQAASKAGAAQGAAAGGAPNNLEQQTLRQITGQAAVAASQGVLDAASSPASGESPEADAAAAAEKPRPAAGRARRTAKPAGPAITSAGLFDVVDRIGDSLTRKIEELAAGPRTFDAQVFLDDSVAPGRVGAHARAVLTAVDGSIMAEASGPGQGMIRLLVKTEARPGSIKVIWGPEAPDGLAPSLLQLVSRVGKRDAQTTAFKLSAPQKELSAVYVVRPVVQKFKLPLTSLDTAVAEAAVRRALDSQGLARGDVVGDLKIEALNPALNSIIGFGPGTVSFKVMTRHLSIR